MALWVQDARVVLTGSELSEWVRPLPSGQRMACRFCPTCGTRLFHQVLGQTRFMSIKPGTLDDTSWLEPAGHLDGQPPALVRILPHIAALSRQSTWF